MGGSREGRTKPPGVDCGRFPPTRMTDLTEKDVAEFRAIFRQETGKEITDAQAREYAMNLLNLVAFVMKEDASAEA